MRLMKDAADESKRQISPGQGSCQTDWTDPSCFWRWGREGCDLNNPASINEFLEGNELRRNANLIRKNISPAQTVDSVIPNLNAIELGPIGKRGAAAALERLRKG